MDPKMDAAMLVKPGEPRSLDEAIALGCLKTRDYSPAELAGTMDQLLRALVTWWRGDTAVQTIFTCLFLHREPDAVLQEPTLAAFIRGIMAVGELSRDMITRAGNAHDEDFCVHLHSLSLAGCLPIDQAARALVAAEEALASRAKQTVSESPDTHIPGIVARLAFLRGLLNAMVNASKTQGRGIPAMIKAIRFAQSQLPVLEKHIGTGVLPDGVFWPYATAHLLGSCPPRMVTFIPIQESIRFLETLLTELELASQVIECSTLRQILVRRSSGNRPRTLSSHATST
jgi:hypothetical protein